MQNIAHIHDITYVSELRQFDLDGRPFRRAAQRGDAVRIHRGAYLPTKVWHALDRTEQYRHQVIAATGASRTHPILSHRSAAVVWGIPLVGELPRLVDVLASEAAGSRTEGSFRRHATRFLDSDIEIVGGVPVTSLRRTVIDLALVLPFPSAVAALDWAIRPGTTASPKPSLATTDLWDVLTALEVSRGRQRVSRAIQFGDCLSGSPGESLSRATIHELGFPAPVLQQRFEDRHGLIGFTDFWWPQYRLIGEFDGLLKYTRGAFGRTLSVSDIVIAEKKREDRLRALGPSVARWLWEDAIAPPSLFTILRDAGLPSNRKGA
ncbi:hypothetical protein [Lacisediminihabitans sp.]|uniref:hypothetical protein n=1 Tax=Lacisediminihabitans sp. TaxID=2787631 RepID=UPI00374D3707